MVIALANLAWNQIAHCIFNWKIKRGQEIKTWLFTTAFQDVCTDGFWMYLYCVLFSVQFAFSFHPVFVSFYFCVFYLCVLFFQFVNLAVKKFYVVFCSRPGQSNRFQFDSCGTRQVKQSATEFLNIYFRHITTWQLSVERLYFYF